MQNRLFVCFQLPCLVVAHMVSNSWDLNFSDLGNLYEASVQMSVQHFQAGFALIIALKWDSAIKV